VKAEVVKEGEIEDIPPEFEGLEIKRKTSLRVRGDIREV
jgi:hypothetical protein